MNQASGGDLLGLSVLVTRPEAQANVLCELIQQARGRPVRFPVLEILGPADKHAVRAQLAQLPKFDAVLFISANAVRYAFPLLPDHIPLDLQIGAVGSATAQELERHGLDPTLVPQQSMDSEGLLATPELTHVEGKQILIVRGNGGRELLQETLSERGAQVHYAEVYRRQIPQRNPANLIRNWSLLADVVTVSSGQSLHNLSTMLGAEGTNLLCETPLVVPSQRVAAQARELGCQKIHVARSANDADILSSLEQIAAHG